MSGVETPALLALLGVAALAGFVDAVAGGGGLIQLPPLLAILGPGAAPAVSKVSSFCGTSAAIVRYAANGSVRWDRLAWAGPVALVGSFLGTRSYLAVLKDAARVVRPGFAVCFLALAAYQVWKALRPATVTAAPRARPWIALAFIAVIGVYDGFVGPGTGMFLFWALTTWMALPALEATGTTKAINGLTNVGALAAFLTNGPILWPLALSMAGANLVGGWLGAHTAIRRGVTFIRVMTAVVCAGASVYLLLT